MTKLEEVARAIKDQRVKDDAASGIPYTPAAHNDVLPMDYRAARAAIKALMTEPPRNMVHIAMNGHLQAILDEESETVA